MKTRSIINPTYLLRYAILKLTVLKLIFRAHESNSILTLLTSIPESKIGFILHAVQENQESLCCGATRKSIFEKFSKGTESAEKASI